MAQFAVSFQAGNEGEPVSLVLQAPSARTPATIFLVTDSRGAFRLDLVEHVIAAHRAALPITDHIRKAEKSASTSVLLNFEFVNEYTRAAVSNGSYSVTTTQDPVVSMKYVITGVKCTSDLAGFKRCSIMDLMKTLGSELNRAYDRINDMIETSRARGLDLEEDERTLDFAAMERVQQADKRRKNLSAVNPTVRAKKVAKGFGSK